MTTSLEALQRVPYIQYPIHFQNNKVQVLIDFGNKVNAMTPAYTVKLGLTIQKTSIGAQKIDGLPLETYGIALIRFSI